MRLEYLEQAQSCKLELEELEKMREAVEGNDNITVNVWFGGENFVLSKLLSRSKLQHAIGQLLNARIDTVREQLTVIGVEL